MQYNKRSTRLVIMFVLVMIIGYLFSWLITNLTGTSFISLKDFFYKAFTITDAKNYIKIAEYGYVTEGQDKYLLVFFPIYPLMIRVLHTLSFLDYSACAFIISLLSSCVSVVLLYKIACLDYEEEIAVNIATVYILYPVMSFMVTGLNEGVFMMFLLASVYCVRMKKYLTAGLFGFMVSLTRLPGLCIGAFMLVETIQYITTSVKNKSFDIRILCKQFFMMIMTLMGLITYLLINYVLHNDFFKFFDYQNEIWYQHVSNPINVIFNVIIKGQIKIGINYIGYSNLIACIIILLAVVYGLIKRVRISYLIYMFVYFWICYSASWLLSGARYSIGAFVIFISMGLFITSHKFVKKVFIPLNFVLFIYVSYLCTNLILH